MKVQTTQSLILATLTAVLLTACGSSGVTGEGTIAQDNSMTPIFDNSGSNNAAGAPKFSFQLIGKNATLGYGDAPSTSALSPVLMTDSKLKVKIAATPATRNQNTPTSTNYSANYTCATYRVTVQVEYGNGVMIDLHSQETGVLSVPGTAGCAGSSPSEMMDFTYFMQQGHGNVRIKVEALTTNANCIAFKNYPYQGWPASYATKCSNDPMQSIYQYHVVNGTMQIAVDGTDFTN